MRPLKLYGRIYNVRLLHLSSSIRITYLFIHYFLYFVCLIFFPPTPSVSKWFLSTSASDLPMISCLDCIWWYVQVMKLIITYVTYPPCCYDIERMNRITVTRCLSAVNIFPPSLRILGFPYGAEAVTSGFLLLELWNGKYSCIYFALTYFSLFAELISIRTLIYPPLMLLFQCRPSSISP